MFRKFMLTLVLGATFFALNPALAHEGAVGIVKERMKLMKFIAQNTKHIAPYAMGAQEMNLKAVEGAALSISMGAERVIDKFPKGSTSMSSEAKPNIWENWAEFEGMIKALQADATKLYQLAKDGKEAEIMAQFGKMASNCKTCHTKFRLKKE